MKRVWLVLALCLAGSAARAGGVEVGGDLSGTVQVGGLAVERSRILVTPKPGYVHLIWDAYADRAAIQAAGRAFHLQAAAVDLARTLGLQADPQATAFKVDVAEFPERDDYGAPRWDKLKFLGRFEIALKGKKWVAKKRAG